MSDTRIKQAMADIAEINKTRGVEQRGGKKYTMVADRVEVFRKHFGLELGVVTTIVEMATEMPTGINVIVRADIRDASGILATGHAAEVWGAGHVNKTSALENAETSAIGRALAALGLHGGEFASANELDAVKRKEGDIIVPNARASSASLKRGGPDGKGWWPEYEKAIRSATSRDQFDAVEAKYDEHITKWQGNAAFKAAYEELRDKELARINEQEQAA